MRHWFRLIAIALIVCGGGCARNRAASPSKSTRSAYLGAASDIEYAAVDPPAEPSARQLPAPWTLRTEAPKEYWELTLEEAVRLAMSRSQVVRDLGGRVVEMSIGSATRYGPALQEADPRSGVEAALSAFDAQFSTGMFWGHDERTFNNVFFGGGVAGLVQDTKEFQLQLAKTGATGTQFAIRNLTNYDRNNSPLNRFPSVWETMVEGEVRHPLMQGGGLEFNRIAGPNGQPGAYNGVLLARINTDVAAIDFEIAIRNLVRDIELTYWELYFAYRDLDAKTKGRDAARETWEVVRDKMKVGAEDEEREALAREQFYAAQAAVEDALAGNSLDGATVGGVFGVERKLRWLLGLPATGERLLRPADQPTRVDVIFPWEEVATETLWRRAELRRQQWEVKRKQLELVAARNMLKMRVDVVGQYRLRGFGDHLVGGDAPNSSAYGDLLTGDLQGGRIGVEVATPVGNRIGHTAVRHAQLELRRQRDIYQEQELRVSHEASHAYAQLARSYQLTRTNYNRSQAAVRQFESISRKYESGVQDPTKPDILLENVLAAQSRAVQAATAYHRSLVDYNQSLMNLHFAKGTLLDYHQVFLSEGQHSPAAMRSAQQTASRMVPRDHECLQVPCPVTQGPYHQHHMDLMLDLDQLTLDVAPVETVPTEEVPSEELPTP